MASKKIDVLAEFNWANGTVRSVYEDGESTLELGDGVLDPVSIGLVIRAGLRNGEDEWRPMMVDEDEIEEQHFRAQPESMLDTSLGCLEVRNVEKIRAPESSRYTRTWYATDLDYVPVFIEHGKKDGDHMETRIRSLTLDGQSVSAKAGC